MFAIGFVVLAVAGFSYERQRRAAEPIQSFPYRNCDQAHAAGVSDIRAGDPRYSPHQDRDGDGSACEAFP